MESYGYLVEERIEGNRKKTSFFLVYPDCFRLRKEIDVLGEKILVIMKNHDNHSTVKDNFELNDLGQKMHTITINTDYYTCGTLDLGRRNNFEKLFTFTTEFLNVFAEKLTLEIKKKYEEDTKLYAATLPPNLIVPK